MGDIVKYRDLKKEEKNKLSNNIIKNNYEKDDIEIIAETKKESEKKKINKIVNEIEKLSCIISNEDDDNNNLPLLNIIDGLIETPGRILIMTTNKPEFLDKALIRPGRIDIKINFKKCSLKMMKDLINNYFNCNLSLEDFKDCKEFYYTC